MSYQTLELMIAVMAPIIIFTTVSLTIKVPDVITGLPAWAQHVIEAAGGLMIVAAWLPIGRIAGGLAWMGLLLLAMPTVARYIGEPAEVVPSRGRRKPLTW